MIEYTSKKHTAARSLRPKWEFSGDRRPFWSTYNFICVSGRFFQFKQSLNSQWSNHPSPSDQRRTVCHVFRRTVDIQAIMFFLKYRLTATNWQPEIDRGSTDLSANFDKSADGLPIVYGVRTLNGQVDDTKLQVFFPSINSIWHCYMWY